MALFALAIFAYNKLFHKEELGGRPVDIISSGENLYVLSEGQRKCGFPCIDTPVDYIQPTLWEINTVEKKVAPYVITEKFEDVSSYGNSCDKMVDLGTSIFLHCPQSFLFSKQTKGFVKIENSISGKYFAYSSSNELLGVASPYSQENKINFYDKDLNQVKTLEIPSDFKGFIFVKDGLLVFYSDKILTFDNKFNQTITTPLSYSSNDIFLDSANQNVGYSYGPLGPITDNIYKLDLSTNQRLDSLAFPETRQDRDTVYTYNLSSFVQTNQKIYFLVINYISEHGVSKTGSTELAIADKSNLNIIKKVPLKLNKNDSLSEEWLSTNVNMLTINGQNVFVLVNDWNQNGKLLIYDLEGNFVKSLSLRSGVSKF